MSYEGLSNLHLMAAARNYNAWLFRVIRPYAGKRILEIGAGIGTFTAFLSDREIIVSTDMDTDCLGALSRRFEGAPNIEIFHLDITRLDSEISQHLRSKAFDTVLCFNVLEHIDDDIRALKNIRSLAPEGTLLLVVPAFPFLYGVEDRAVGHHRRYTREQVLETMRSAGYRTEKSFYFNSVGAVLWFLKGRVLKSPPTTLENVALYDRIFVPVFSRLENVLPVPFGQSLVAVGRP